MGSDPQNIDIICYCIILIVIRRVFFQEPISEHAQDEDQDAIFGIHVNNIQQEQWEWPVLLIAIANTIGIQNLIKR